MNERPESQPPPDKFKEDREYINHEVRFPPKEVYVGQLEEAGLEKEARAYEKALEIIKDINNSGGLALLIGGCVRDALFNKVAKDFDVEVYGLEASKIEEIARRHGKVSEVGAAFGILKIDVGGIDVDLSLPRTDSKVEAGHTGFDVKTDPNMSIKEAARRRDFTMNTVAADPFTGEVYDSFGGVKDIHERRLRITDPERFADDPLRVLRGIQFIGRFGLEPDDQAIDVMREMTPLLKEIFKERILEEWKKLLLKSEKPSLGLSTAVTLGVMRELHPQFMELKERPKPGEHADVDKWIHALASVDEAAKIIRREEISEKERMVLMLSTLCGNLTKGEEGGGRSSEKRSQPDTQKVLSFLKAINADNKTRDKVLSITASRLVPTMLYVKEQSGNPVSSGEIRRLAAQIHPATIRELVLAAEADYLGRGQLKTEIREELQLSGEGYHAAQWLVEKAAELQVEESKPGNLIMGKQWMQFGYKPGRHLGELIKLSDDLRDEKGMTRVDIFNALDGVEDPNVAVEKLREMLNQ